MKIRWLRCSCLITVVVALAAGWTYWDAGLAADARRGLDLVARKLGIRLESLSAPELAPPDLGTGRSSSLSLEIDVPGSEAGLDTAVTVRRADRLLLEPVTPAALHGLRLEVRVGQGAFADAVLGHAAEAGASGEVSLRLRDREGRPAPGRAARVRITRN